MTIIVILVLALVQLISYFMRPVRVDYEMVVLPLPLYSWEPEVEKVQHQLVAVAPITPEAKPFYQPEWDEQDEWAKPTRKDFRRFSKHDLTKRRQKEKSDLRRGQRAIKALMRA